MSARPETHRARGGPAAAPRCLPAGDGAVLAELGSLDETLALFQALGEWPDGVEDVVPAARTLLVLFRPSALAARDVAAWLRRTAAGLEAAAAGGGGASAPRPDAAARRVEIPVRYTGEDLEAVAERLGLSRAELIERHTGSDYLAAFAGFAPGFVYLAGGDPCFHGVPRRAAPRVRVPAGSVAVAGDFSAVYPSDSPGGWQLLGVTPLRMWDMDRAEPALVRPGFRVRFRDLDAAGAAYSLPGAETGAVDRPAAAPSVPATPAACFEVLAAGLQTLVQDLGRPGLTGMGVSLSGALDRGALRSANRIVGNPADAAVLENALGGLRLACRGRAVVAVTGARAELSLVTAAGIRLPAAPGRPLALDDGDELRVGAPSAGVRCYVAVRGGWDVAPVLGSRATDTLAGIGPAPLRPGDRLPVGAAPDAARPGAVLPDGEAAPPPPGRGDLVTLDIVLGPRADWFTPAALALLAGQEWTVTPQSDRVGMRLSGAEPLVRDRQGELPSEGTVAGAIQVPAGGQPVLFLADHPLTGGYPVIGAVVGRDLDRAAQIPVGARLRFRPIGPFEEILP
ncbi:5-oxoprolinase/urea amidolyase family protein [Castellaniella sp.]|uniref:5-oxoprolinase subunit B/C family protein n=1 Tax=Castellaniella sp. TaxID=1955812 RepID=UPI002AFF8A15|nr:5-oxoprolinase/urea amidolyase family protein [Castellaniella sp.]